MVTAYFNDCAAIQLACVKLICSMTILAHHFLEIKGRETLADYKPTINNCNKLAK